MAMVKIPAKSLKEIIAMRIVEQREKAGLTQKELGIKLGFKEENAQAQIYQYEKGYRSPSKKRLEKMAELFSVPVDVLIINTENVYRSSGAVAEKPKEYLTEFDKEIALFKEEVKKYGAEGVRTARELLPVIFKGKKK